MPIALPPRPLPLVGVTPTLLLGSVVRLDAAAAQAAGGLFHALPLDEALTKRWETDAWLVPYKLTGFANLKAGWPRFKQEVLADVRAQGADIVATMLVLDFDLPKIEVDGKKVKQRWTAELLEAFLEKFDVAVENGFTLASDWTVFYTTNHGARGIFVLDQPLAVEKYKPYLKALIAAFMTAGIPIDGTTECVDWTHLFRLPYVVDSRYGQPTEPHVFEIRAENRLNLASLTPIGPDDQVGLALDLKVDHRPRPSEAEIDGLLTPSIIGVAKKWLKGHACYAALFEHAKIALAGRRDNTLTSFIGDAINQLFPRAQITKEHVYALFHGPVATTLEPDGDTPDWLAKAWDLIERFWAQQMGEAEARETFFTQNALTVEEKKRQILQGMKEWCNDRRLHSTIEAEALSFMSEHMIAVLEDRYFLMTLNGRYDNIGIRDRAIGARSRELGIDEILVTESLDKDGVMKPISFQRILKVHGTIVASMRARIGDFGGWISDIETESACLNVRTYARRSDLVPEFNPDVDAWLRQLGGEHYEKFVKWIGLALAFDKGAICALAIIGPQGCGKKMLVTGLAEAITTQRFVDASEVFSAFNAGLLESPIVNVDEGWPHGVNPADTFRRLTGGNTNTINRKFMATSTLVAPLRVILTANNDDIILDLVGKRDLTRRDQEALEIRIFPINVAEEAKTWLRERGGHEFTAGWIRGDGGQPSRWVVAKHFLWLYEQHKDESDPRLLVEGELSGDMSMALRTTGNAIAPVIETVLLMLEGIEKGKAYKGGVVEDGSLYVTTTEVLNQYRQSLGRTSRFELSTKKVCAALNAVNSRQTASRMLRSRPDAGKQRWHELDLPLLHRVAERDGRSVNLLTKLVEGAPITPMPSIEEIPSLNERIPQLPPHPGVSRVRA